MQRDIGPDERVSDVVVQAVAEETGRDPAALRPFVESIDAEAVDELFAGADGDEPRTLRVTYEGCRVDVDGDVVRVEQLLDA